MKNKLHILLLLLYIGGIATASSSFPLQNEEPIVNFTLNENDTTRYTHHYLRAQESCYEQYLREHNMRVLTAEDADDSYDELKKAVLAWQLYGLEASLPLCPKEEPAAPQTAGYDLRNRAFGIDR